MITINTRTGEVSLSNELLIFNGLDIEIVKNYVGAKKTYEYQNFEEYSVEGVEGKFLIGIDFYQGKLETLSFYVGPPELSFSERGELYGLLELLGGEKSYPWGRVFFHKDIKSSVESVTILYSSFLERRGIG